MKSNFKMLFITALLSTTVFMAQAQHATGKFTVSTKLKETKGSYEQRKVFRKFLNNFMKDCPYISHFNIQEVNPVTDNHKVVWTYQVNDWSDITRFYNWISDQLKSENSGFKTAMSPYAPDYAIGGNISMEKTSKFMAVKDHKKAAAKDNG